MRLRKLSIRGLLAFNDTASVNFEALPAGIYAIWGKNGDGKTTLAEAATGAIYRQFHSRAKTSLADYATRRDAFIELDMDMGDEHLLARVSVDPNQRASDALLQVETAAGWHRVNDGKVSTYDAAIKKRFPPLSQLMAGPLGLQSRKGSFAGLSQAERKELFMRLIGADRYVNMAEAAKVQRQTAQVHLEHAEAALVRLREEGDPTLVNALRGQLDIYVEAQQMATEAHAKADQAMESALADRDSQRELVAMAKTAYDAALAATSAAAQTAAQLKLQHAAAVNQAQTIFSKIDVARISHATYLRSLEEAIAALPTDEAITRQVDEEIRQWRASKTARREQINKEIDRLVAQITAGVDAEAAAHSIEAIRPELEAAQQTQAAHRKAREVAAAVVRQCVVDEHQYELVMTRRQTLETSISHAVSVPCKAEGAYAGCQFLTAVVDAKKKLAAIEIPTWSEGALQDAERREEAAKRDEQDADALVDKLQKEIAALTTQAKMASEVAAARGRRDGLLEELARVDEDECAGVEQRRASAAVRVSDRDSSLEEYRERLRRAGEKKDVLMQGLHTELAAAESQVQKEYTLLAAAESDLMAAQAIEHDRYRAFSHASVAERARQESIDACQADILRAKEAMRLAEQRVLTQRAHLGAAEAAAQEVAEQEQKLVALQTDVAEWNALFKAFDRDGLPTIEIDAAGPSVTAHANALLSNVLDGRFSCRLTTQAPTADGKALRDVFDIEVFDGAKGGAQRALGDLSGGQQVILDEVMKSAIALFMNQQNIQPIRTCVRDETTGALHHDVIPDYVKLLRSVREEGDFEHLLFITHSVDAALAADGILWCHDGRIDVLTDRDQINLDALMQR